MAFRSNNKHAAERLNSSRGSQPRRNLLLKRSLHTIHREPTRLREPQPHNLRPRVVLGLAARGGCVPHDRRPVTPDVVGAGVLQRLGVGEGLLRQGEALQDRLTDLCTESPVVASEGIAGQFPHERGLWCADVVGVIVGGVVGEPAVVEDHAPCLAPAVHRHDVLVAPLARFLHS